ncbi:MAG: ABC transporter ATP-binding protein [Alphaproteobacteria bacterium]
MSSISVRNLKLNFGTVEVLKNLNVEVEDGEFLVLLGPSGCGKSTLLNCIAGLLEATDGQIFIKGQNVTWKEPKDRGIGMVFQSYALYPQMSVKGNLSFGLKNQRIAKDEIERRVGRAAEMLQIEGLLKRKPAALSGGQRQRVAIGRALVREADVFLFDEPLSNLDAKLRSELRVEIKRLHTRIDSTMVYVTHDQIEALTLADRIAVMRDGVIQQLDEPHTIYNKPTNRFVAGFLGSPSMSFLDGAIQGGANGAIVVEGQSISMAGYQAITETNGDRKAILGVRPEHVEIKSEPVAGSTIAAVVDIEEPMGADSLQWLRIGDQQISVRKPPERSYEMGSTAYLDFDMSKASIFDAASEGRL